VSSGYFRRKFEGKRTDRVIHNGPRALFQLTPMVTPESRRRELSTPRTRRQGCGVRSTGIRSAFGRMPLPATGGVLTSASLVPDWQNSRWGKLSQAIAHNAHYCRSAWQFRDDCLISPRDLSRTTYPIHLVNSVNNDRIEAKRRRAFEVIEVFSRAPDFHLLPRGQRRGNLHGLVIVAIKGRSEREPSRPPMPRMLAFQAHRFAPFVDGSGVKNPGPTIATASASETLPPGDLGSWAREDSNGYFGAIDDAGIPLAAHRPAIPGRGYFVEPSSAISRCGIGWIGSKQVSFHEEQQLS